MILPLANYLGFFYDYFATRFVASSLLFIVAALAGIFSCFKSSTSPRIRSSLLISIMIISVAIWAFVISSLAFCVLLVRQYMIYSFPTILLVARLSLVSSLVVGPLIMLLLHNSALKSMYASMENANIAEQNHGVADALAKASHAFVEVKSRLVLSHQSSRLPIFLNVLLPEKKLPPSFAFDSRKAKIVALKEETVRILEDDELETVIAHELAHIKHRDALQKAIVTAYRIALPIDPIARLVEASLYRENEYAADEFSARLTRKPASLASALLKIYDSVLALANDSRVIPSQFSLLIERDGEDERRGVMKIFRRKVLSKQPPLSARIERLLKLASEIPA